MRRLHWNNYDLLLLSAGGNDIVGPYDFGFFLKQYDPELSAYDAIRWDRLDRRLEQIRSAYADIIELSIEYGKTKSMRIITHTYDYAIPSPKGASFVGGLIDYDNGRSWMHPYFLGRGYGKASSEHRKEIAKGMLTGFKNRLYGLQKEYAPKFIVVDTQGTLAESEWENEIHPTSEGFRKITERIYEEGIKPHLTRRGKRTPH